MSSSSTQVHRGISIKCHHLSRFVFFFQAEDGIRDLTVTGVQTCALPISLTVTWYLPGVRTPVNVIGYTALYLLFHAPRLVDGTVPVSTFAPDESTTLNDTPLTAPGTMRYACLASLGR